MYTAMRAQKLFLTGKNTLEWRYVIEEKSKEMEYFIHRYRMVTVKENLQERNFISIVSEELQSRFQLFLFLEERNYHAWSHI